MKNTIKKISAFFLSLVLLLGVVPLAELDVTASAEELSGTCGDNLTWTLDTSTGELVISGTGDMYDWSSEISVPWHSYNSNVKTVIIKDGVLSVGNWAFGYYEKLAKVVISDSVASIGSDSFRDCYSLADLTIGNGVKSIGDYAFCNCTSLTEIVIPNSVTNIGENAFWCCNSLISVTIPYSVTSIGVGAFNNCRSLESIKVDEANTVYSSDGDGILFNYERTELIQYPTGKPGIAYTIPDGVITIVDYAFNSCKNLTSVTISNSVESIGESAFSYCDKLTSATIGNGVITVGRYAFSNCDNLAIVTIGNGVTTIGRRAFEYCGSLTDITVSDNISSIGIDAFYDTGYYNNSDNWENDVLYIGKYLIDVKESINVDFAIKEGTKTIAERALEYCTNLKNVTIPDSITNIGWCAFYSCDSITNVYYKGTQEQFGKITIDSGNEDLTNATIHFLGHEHSCSTAVTQPTCTERGYTTYKCECGDSYINDYVDATGHSYLDGKCIWCGDTNVTPSSIIDITYIPSEDTHKLFTVTCAERASMIQFIEPDGGTRTYGRNNKNVTITSYNADGEVVGELSRDLAYEVWEIYSNMSVGTTIRVRAKFNSRWELDKRSLYVYEYNPVISMELSKTSGKKGAVPATVVADEKTEKVMFKMPDGSSATVLTYTTDENGNRVFSGKAWANEDGLNIINVYVRRNNVWKLVGTLEYTVE